eukprot:SAG31_NODE_25425_length_461_cov_2.265193_1_plen_82_part_10
MVHGPVEGLKFSMQADCAPPRSSDTPELAPLCPSCSTRSARPMATTAPSNHRAVAPSPPELFPAMAALVVLAGAASRARQAR